MRSVFEQLIAPAAVLAESRIHSVPWCYSASLQITGLTAALPVDLYLWPNCKSYTGQPLAELHMISSPPILEAVLSELFTHAIRPAQPGEFTLRAFLAGRLDLPQAEAILGVIDATTDRELQTALDQLAGGLSSQIGSLRSDLLNLLADLEAGLDFADEPIEFVSHDALVERLGLARDAVAELLERASERMRAAPKARVVLAGPPNAGKSTLFNALAEGGAALVSEVAGTTRDYLTAEVTLDGVAVVLIDTAGHEAAPTGINRESQKRRQEQIDEADLVVLCHPAGQPEDHFCEVGLPAARERVLQIVTKCDVVRPENRSVSLAVSARSGAGLDELATRIARRLSTPAAGARQLVGTTAARSRDSLIHAQSGLDRALTIARNERDQELLAIEVRDVLDDLGTIAGAVYTDDILDRIFSRFCIGK